MPQDARLHPRFAVDASADVLGHEVMLLRPLLDLSLGGCRFAGPGWEAVGAPLQLVLHMPTLGTNLPLQGIVARSSEHELAVRFHELNDEQKWALKKSVRQLQQQVPLRHGAQRSQS